MIRRFALAGSAVLAVVGVVAAGALPATAHVTVSPQSMPRGTSDVILTFRVPNESATAATTGLKVQFPLDHPIIVVNPEAGSGWRVNVVRTTLAKPITTDDGTFTSVTSEVDWSGGSIPVGQFGAFNVLAQGIPSQASELVFKAIQTYSDGTVVSWIQADHPLPLANFRSQSQRQVKRRRHGSKPTFCRPTARSERVGESCDPRRVSVW